MNKKVIYQFKIAKSEEVEKEEVSEVKKQRNWRGGKNHQN